MKNSTIINPSEHSNSPIDFLKKHCAIIVDDHYKTPSSTDELVTGQYIYLSQKLPFHCAVIVVDNLSDFHQEMKKEFCQKLINEKDYKFRAISPSKNELNDIIGFSERVVFHREHGLQHQLLCNILGDAAWVNVTGMEVFLEKSLFLNKNNETKKENGEFIESFLKSFNEKLSSPNPPINVNVADYRDAKSHLNSMVRDLSQCVNHGEKISWLKTTERMFFEYRSYVCRRATPDDRHLFEMAMNKVSSAMEGCLERISKPQEPRKNKSLNELPPESKRMLDLNKTSHKNNTSDPSP